MKPPTCWNIDGTDSPAKTTAIMGHQVSEGICIGDVSHNDEARQAIEAELDALVIDSLFSARGNLVAGQRWLTISYWLGIPATVLSTLLAGGAGVSAILGSVGAITATLAFLSATLVAIRGFLRPDELATSYSKKGNKLLAVRSEAKLLVSAGLKVENMTNAKAYSQAKKLRDDYNRILLEEPLHIPGWAYSKARSGIESGESDYVLKRKGGE